MDWLGFEFCVIIWVLCISQLQAAPSVNDELKCVQGQVIPPPDECNTCICFEEEKHCTRLVCSKKYTGPEPKCISGEHIPKPDTCNDCICFGGGIHCTNKPCNRTSQRGPVCDDDQPVYRPDECNECYCINGQLECSDLVCIRGSKCVKGEVIPKPDSCNKCKCHEGHILCTKHQCPKIVSRNLMESEPKCISGEHIPKPDTCNDCICFGGEIHCTNKPCNRTSQIGPVCDDDQPVYRPDECNECYCIDGQLECSDLVCIRGSKCVKGEVIPKPDSCNKCKCHEGHILCTKRQCPKTISRNSMESDNSSAEVQPVAQCEEGDYIPPPPPPDDCNTCLCINQRVLCTMETCTGDVPDINGRFKEEQTNNYLQSFDKPISVEPFIYMFSKHSDKKPTKLIHRHEYNGFHQEIKMHTQHLPKDRTKLLAALANTLYNPALADIGNNIKETSSNSPKVDNRLQLIPSFEGDVVPKHSLDSSEIQLTHSSKLITSGSQSNETILVIPEKTDSKNTNTVIPLTTQYDKNRNTVSSPAPQMYNNMKQIIPFSSEEEKMVEYYSENPSSYISSFDDYKIVRNPAKFDRPGQHSIVKQTNPTRNIVDISNQNIESVIPLHPQSTNVNGEKISYVPFNQDDKQFKAIPSEITSNPHELQNLPPDQLARHMDVYKLIDTSAYPVHRPDQEHRIIASDKEGSPPRYLLKPNPNQFNLPQNGVETSQNTHLPILNIVSDMDNPFKKVNKPTVSTPSQFEIKPFQTELKFKSHTMNNYYFSPSNTGSKPDQVKRVPFIDNEETAQMAPHDNIKPNPPVYHNDDLLPPTTEFSLDEQDTTDTGLLSQKKPIHYEFEPALQEPNNKFSPQNGDVHNQDLYKLHSQVSYLYDETQHKPPEIELKHSYSEEYNLPQSTLKPDPDKGLNHYHHETPSKTTYVTHNTSQFGFIDEQNNIPAVENKPANTQISNRGQNNSPFQYHQNQNPSDLTMAKVYQHLNQPSNIDFDVKRRENKTYYVQSILSQHNKYYPPGPDGQSHYDKYIYSHKSRPTQFQSLQTRTKSFFLYDQGSVDHSSANVLQYTPHSDEDLVNKKVNQFKPPHPLYNFPRNQQTPETLDDRGSAGGFKYPSHSEEDSRNNKLNQFKPSHLQHTFPKNHQNPETFDDRESGDGFQYTSHSDEDLRITKVNQFKPPHPQYIFPQNDQISQTFGDRGSPNGFQYISHSEEDPTNKKVNQIKSFDPQQFISDSADRLKNPQFKQVQDKIKSVFVIDRKVPNSITNNTSVKSSPFKTKHFNYTPWNFNGKQPKSQIVPDKVQNHEIIWPENTNSDTSNPKLLSKTDKTQNKSSVFNYYPWLPPKQNQTHANNIGELQPKKDNNSTSAMDVMASNITNQFRPYLKPNNSKDSLFSDNLKEPNSTIFNNITYESPYDQDESRDIVKSGNSLAGNKNKLESSKYKAPGEQSKQEIDDQISNIFSKPPQTKFETTNNNSKSKQILTTTMYPDTESTNNYQNPPRNKKVPEKKRDQPPVQYPNVHIILHQPNVFDDTGSAEFFENGLVSQVPDINSGNLGAVFLPKIMHSRIRHRPKDKKEECGDGTEWISNCHGCSCHDGLAICFKLPDCNLRPFGEPMICKPYSRFKMGNCYSCECNGDGVSECDASDCKEDEEGRDNGSNNLVLPVYNKFFDEKKTRDILQYYNFYKKLPKDCPTQAEYPTCEAGTRWVSRCNICECDESGKHKCTPIDDCVLDYATYGKPGRCKPNSKFYPKSTGMPCVECHCDDEGNPYCPAIDYNKH